jgi:N-methylhydantoinase A
VAEIKAEYNRCYTQLYGRTIPERDIEILTWSVVVSSMKKKPQPVPPIAKTSTAISSSVRSVYVPSAKQTQNVPTFWRPDLKSGEQVSGPALVEEPQTTTFVTSGFVARMDGHLNLILERSSP